MKNELVEQFKVEELEERMEFAKWTASAKAGHDDSKGTYVEGSVSVSF